MTEQELKPCYEEITILWQFMKEFLIRTDNETEPDKYWGDVVARFREYGRGKGEFLNTILVRGIRELERIKKCTSES